MKFDQSYIKPIQKFPFQVPLLCIITALQIFIIVKLGPFYSPDTLTFNNWSDELINSGFNIFKYFSATENWISGANKLYLNHIMLVSILRLVFSENWAIVLITINVICQTSAAFLLWKTVKLATSSKFSAIIALGTYCLALDAFVWSRYFMSDSVFLLLNYYVFYKLIKYYVLPNQSTPGNMFAICLISILTAFYRPHGIVTLAIVTCFIIFHGVIKKYSPKIIISVIVLFLLASFSLHAFIIQHYQSWPDMPLYGWVDFNAKFYQMGVVVHNRPETYLAEPTNYFSFLKITLIRFISFFHFFPSGWSLSHRLISTAFFVPIYLGMLLSIINLYRDRVSKNTGIICLISITLILGIAGLSAVSILDYDWRYRLSVTPIFVLVAVLSLPWTKWYMKRNFSEPVE